MNQYKRLLSNTFIFAVGTFSSKILVILMLRFYTGVLTQDEMGVADLIIKTTSILYPVAKTAQAGCVHHRSADSGLRLSDLIAVQSPAEACSL